MFSTLEPCYVSCKNNYINKNTALTIAVAIFIEQKNGKNYKVHHLDNCIPDNKVRKEAFVELTAKFTIKLHNHRQRSSAALL